MSYNRPILDELNRMLGLEKKESNKPVFTSIPAKCMTCCWAAFTGDTIFCLFTACEKYNQVFANAIHGGSRHG